MRHDIALEERTKDVFAIVDQPTVRTDLSCTHVDNRWLVICAFDLVL